MDNKEKLEKINKLFLLLDNPQYAGYQMLNLSYIAEIAKMLNNQPCPVCGGKK